MFDAMAEYEDYETLNEAGQFGISVELGCLEGLMAFELLRKLYHHGATVFDRLALAAIHTDRFTDRGNAAIIEDYFAWLNTEWQEVCEESGFAYAPVWPEYDGKTLSHVTGSGQTTFELLLHEGRGSTLTVTRLEDFDIEDTRGELIRSVIRMFEGSRYAAMQVIASLSSDESREILAQYIATA